MSTTAEYEKAFQALADTFGPLHDAIKSLDSMIKAEYPLIVSHKELAEVGRMIAERQTTPEIAVMKLRELQKTA